MFRVAARAVLELGSELISSDMIAFYELIKNGLDARSRDGVTINFDIVLARNDFLVLLEKARAKVKDLSVQGLRLLLNEMLGSSASEERREAMRQAVAMAKDHEQFAQLLESAYAKMNTITISDTGTGMSQVDLQKNFLVIGTASRKRAVDEAITKGSKESPFLGEKGIGRLSVMRLGGLLKVESAKESDQELNVLSIDWRDFDNLDAMIEQISVVLEPGGAKATPTWSGTRITIGALTEHWTRDRVQELAKSEFAKLSDPYAETGLRPRIVLRWNGDRIAIPILPKNLLEACHAKMTANYTIENDVPKMVCTVDIFALGFEHPPQREVMVIDLADLRGLIVGTSNTINETALRSVGPFSFEAYWYNRQLLSQLKPSGNRKAMLDGQTQWSGLLLFRDGLRVFPYGEEEDDWLMLDRKALKRSGYTLNKTQFLGRVSISRTGNPFLLDQTNREGLRVNDEQRVFLEVLRHCVQDQLGEFMKHVTRQYKEAKIDLSGALDQVETLEVRAKQAVQQLRRVVEPKNHDTVDLVQDLMKELSDLVDQAKIKIDQVEVESQQMIDMAGIGLMVEVIAHELARASENALRALGEINAADIPEAIKSRFTILQAELKTMSKRIRILDPLSVSGRQRKEVFVIDELVGDTITSHEAQFRRHKIHAIFEGETQPIRIRAVKGMIVQILENLISNSIYWIETKKKYEPSYSPQIVIKVTSHPPTLTFEDNGPGISPEHVDQVFRLFFSLKETSKRRGLGLYIAREAAEDQGGTLTLDEQENPKTGRLNRFVLILPQGAEL